MFIAEFFVQKIIHGAFWQFNSVMLLLDGEIFRLFGSREA
jgi:hypothetical protein